MSTTFVRHNSKGNIRESRTSVNEIPDLTNEGEMVRGYDNSAYENDETITGVNEHEEPTSCAEYYDPYNFSNTDHPTTFWGSVFHLIIISAGPDIFTIPFAFQGVGYAVGFVGVWFIVYLYAYNLHMIVWSEYQICKQKRIPRLSYADTVYYAFKDGPTGLQCLASCGWCLINAILVLLWIGRSCYNVVLISECVQDLYTALFSASIEVHSTMQWVIVPLLLLCWIRKLNYLVPLSVLANILTIVAVLVLVFHLIFDPTPLVMDNAVGSPQKLPIFCGSVLFTLNATGIIMPLKNEMNKPRKFDGLFGVLGTAYVPTALVLAFYGLFCCLKYGNKLQQSVIENLPKDEFSSLLVIGFYALTLTLQFPLLTYVVFDVIWNDFMRKHHIWSCVIIWEYGVRTAVVVVVFLAAFAVPNVAMFLSLSGTVGTCLDSMIFPAIVHSLVSWNVSEKHTFASVLCKNMVIIVAALTLISLGLQDCIRQIKNEWA